MVTGDWSDKIDVYHRVNIIPYGHETARIPIVTGREGGPIACVLHIFCTFFAKNGPRPESGMEVEKRDRKGSKGGHLGVIWESFGSHLGVI